MDKLVETVIEVINIYDLAFQLFSDKTKAIDWMLESNEYFFHKSPIKVAFEGNGSHVLVFLRQRLGL